ncbi:MAG: nucleotidyltransferase family protein, partial [bacterium]|nr:nucleotidyltransferase family protein [bacterium]
MIELSPEMLLLLACCRTNREDSGETEIHRLIDNPPDWEAFYRLAKNHKVPPTVYRDLLQYAGDRIPADISGKFKKQADMHKIRALKASAQMIDLPGLFEKKQLPLIFLKGPALAALLYGDISSRHTGDIDVLVESRDIEAI